MNICARIPGTTKIKAHCEKHFREHQRLFEMHSVIICTSVRDRKYAILRLPAHLQRAAAIPTSLFCEIGVTGVQTLFANQLTGFCEVDNRMCRSDGSSIAASHDPETVFEESNTLSVVTLQAENKK